MTSLKSFAISAAFLTIAAVAGAQPALTPQDIKSIAEIRNQAIFCEGKYALCIKAARTPIPTLDRLGNYYNDKVVCSCNVEDGISMGPGQCADRRPVEQNGRTYLISTYSNLFNERNGSLNTTLACTGSTQQWAWCYGAPCVVDDRDPSLAHCTCPVQTGPMQTLGGNCTSDNCKYIWSAATPGGDDFANRHFYEYVSKNYPNVKVNMPAKLCTPPQPPK